MPILYHFSPHIDPNTGGVVDPKQFAKNTWTQSEKRALALPRSFFYLNPADREKNWFGKKTPLFKAEVPDHHVYDFDADPLKLKRPGENIQTLIAKVLRRKFKGVKYSGHGYPVVAMFHKVRVTPVK